jgi:hypothetical protein
MIKFTIEANIPVDDPRNNELKELIRKGQVCVDTIHTKSLDRIILTTDQSTFNELWNFSPLQLRRIF